MKRCLLLAARLYPRAWRDRYADEFAALVEDLRPAWRDVADTAAGALRMHLVNAASYWKLAGVMAAVGLIAGGAASFTMPKRYVSTAVVHFDDHGDPAAAETRRVALRAELLSRSGLAELIQHPRLDLYKKDRYRYPMEDIVQNMRKDVRIEAAPGDANTLRVSFAYSDAHKAALVADALARSLARANAGYNRLTQSVFHETWPQFPQPSAPELEIVEFASVPETGAGPGRAPWLAGGAALGLVAAAFLYRPKRAFVYAAFGLLGALVAGAAAYLLPDRYTSTAVVRILPPTAPKELTPLLQPEPLDTEWQRLAARSLDDEALGATILAPRLSLYRRDRARKPLPDVVARMREDLSIRATAPGTFAISFTYPDRYKAQATVRELVTRLFTSQRVDQLARAEGNPIVRLAAERKLATRLEVLDPATLPETPVSPNRLLIALGGVVGGLTATAAVRTSHRLPARLPASPQSES